MSKKIDTIDVYKIIGVVMVGVTMALCRFNYVKGQFSPIIIPKEMWTVIMNVLTHTVMSIGGIRVPDIPAMKHLKGGIVIVFLAMMGASIFLNIPVQSQWWGALGTVSAVLYGSTKSDL